MVNSLLLCALCRGGGSTPNPTVFLINYNYDMCSIEMLPSFLKVGGERFNFFSGVPKSKTCTIILRGGAEQFMAETERSLHDAIMIVRRCDPSLRDFKFQR